MCDVPSKSSLARKTNCAPLVTVGLKVIQLDAAKEFLLNIQEMFVIA